MEEAKHQKSQLHQHVVVFPFPLQGHVNGMLRIAELLCVSKPINLTFILTVNTYQRLSRYTDIRSRFSRYPGFQFEVIPDGILDEDNPGALDLYDSLNVTAKPLLKKLVVSSSDHERGPVRCMIADGLLGFAIDVAQETGVPIFSFRTVSPANFWTNFCLSDLINAGEVPFQGEDLDVPIVNVKGMEGFLRRRDLPIACRGEAGDKWIEMAVSETRKASRANGLIFNTFQELDSSILAHIRDHFQNVYTIGPLHEHSRVRLGGESSTGSNSSSSLWEEDRSCMQWLDQQPPKSVIYVSFGSIATMTRDAVLQFWYGLMNSGIKFLWVVRPGSVKDSEVPNEIVEVPKERGYVVGWAPQQEVLRHPAVNGFLTHSGWNSTLESIVAGVPMLCWPCDVDQHVNSRLVEKVWGVGLDMKDTCDDKVIEKMVRDLMVLRSDELLEKATRIATLATQSVGQGGSSHASLLRLVEDISSIINTT